MGQPLFYHATVALSFQIEICNLDRTKSSCLATSLYKKVIFTKNWVTRSCHPTDVMYYTMQRSCRGSVAKTVGSQWWGSWFKSACHGSCALRQGTLSPLSSPLEGTHSCQASGCVRWCNILPDASFGQALFRHWLPGLTCQILRLKEKLIDINIPKQQFEKQMQINNIDVWRHPSPTFSTFGRSKSQPNYGHIGFACKLQLKRSTV